MNDGWFMRAVDKLGLLLLMVWCVGFSLYGILWGNSFLVVMGFLPILVLFSWGMVTNTIEWYEETWEYIREGDVSSDDSDGEDVFPDDGEYTRY